MPFYDEMLRKTVKNEIGCVAGMKNKHVAMTESNINSFGKPEMLSRP